MNLTDIDEDEIDYGELEDPTPKTATKATLTIESVSHFLEHISTLEGNILFRGQQQDYPLVPKVARLDVQGDIREAESRMLSDLKRKAIPYLTTKIDNDWDWLAIAQHHGLATRLLDWTTNALAGLWFAVENPAKGTPGVVWTYQPLSEDIILSKEADSPFRGTTTKVFQPDHITSRIVAQGGWFTVHKYQPKREGFIPLNNLGRVKKHLTKLLIPYDRFAPIRSELNRCGINSSVLFPGMDGICRHIERTHSFLRDERAARDRKQPPPLTW